MALQETLLKSLLQKPQLSVDLNLATQKCTLESFTASVLKLSRTWRTLFRSMSVTMDMCVADASKLSRKAETFSHHTYVSSEKQLMVLDIQGVKYTLCDPEIATSEVVDNADNSIFFCCGNLSSEASEKFKEETTSSVIYLD